jgi:hypothetical protein
MTQMDDNVDRVRRIVPLVERVDHTPIVYDTATFMHEMGSLKDDQILLAFRAISWSRNRHEAEAE